MGEKAYKSTSIYKGFSVIEVLVAFSIFSFIVVGISSAFILFYRSDVSAGDRNRAVFFAEEGLEAVRNISDESFSNLIDGVYGLATSSNQWVFSGDKDVFDIYTRTIEISSVDSDTKKVESRVIWQTGRFPTSSLSLFTYFTDWSRTEADALCLDIDILNACWDNTNNFQNLKNITLTNSCDSEVVIPSLEIGWDNLNKITAVSIDNFALWEGGCVWGCSPTGTQSSGTQLNFGSNELMIAPSTTVLADNLLWDADMTSSTIEYILFNLADTTFVSTSAFFPLSCDIFVPDTTAPSAIIDLTASNPTQSTIELAWTSPGDDENIGTASYYDIRYSLSLIDESNWDLATQVSGEPTPLVAGTSQSFIVTGLNPATTYYFAIKTADEVPNISDISNVVSMTTGDTPDNTPPGVISDLVTSLPTISSLVLSWTSPGDDDYTGIAAYYDLRYSTSFITEGNWNLATQVSGEPSPLVAGTLQNMTVGGLDPITTYYFAIKTADEVPNTSAISNIASGVTNASWVTPILESNLDLTGTHDGTKVQTVGNYAYIVRVDRTPDFQIIDINNPLTPVAMGQLSLNGTPNNIYISGNYAFVASTDNNQEMQIINISNPASPSLAGVYNAPGNADARGIYVVGSTAFLTRVSSGERELYILDINNPVSPTLLGSLELGATAFEIVVSGSYAFIASNSNTQELQVINISNLSSPTLATSINLAGNTDATTISFINNTLLIGQRADFRVINITSPGTPVLSGSITLGGTITDIALDFGHNSTYCYVSLSNNSGPELMVIDISNPSSPQIHGSGFIYFASLNGVAYNLGLDRAIVMGTGNNDEFNIVQPQ